MAQDPFSFNVSLGKPSGRSERRYIAPPFDARVISGQDALVLINRQDQVIRLPIDHVRALGLCDRFRPLDAQARHVAQELNVPAGQSATVHQVLKQMADQGVLVSDNELLASLKRSPSMPPGDGIETLFVRTRARPDTLKRLLESLESPQAPDSLKRCVVLDDDPEPASAERTQALVEEFAGRIRPALYRIGRQRRTALLKAIARAADVDADALKWLVSGDDDDAWPSYGSGLNTALLLAAGSRFAIMDDDATLAAFSVDGTDDAVSFRPGHDLGLKFPQQDRPLPDQFDPLSGHALDEHTRFLGTGTAELAKAGEHDLATLFGDVDPQVLHDLSRQSQIRVTSNGTLGDPGTAGIQWLLVEPHDHLRPLLESEQAYRQLLRNRQVARGANHVQAATNFGLMTTTLTGVDNRELLLPTQARGSNEDLLFGSLISFLHPGALHVALPMMLFHMRPEPRQWSSDDFKRPRGTNQGRFLAGQIEQLASETPGSDTNARAALLTGWMRSLASEDHMTLVWRLRHDLVDLRSDTVERLSARRRELDAPKWLAADIDTAIDAHAGITREDLQHIETLAGRLPGFAARYAEGLPHWQAAWQHCSETGISPWLDQVTEKSTR